MTDSKTRAQPSRAKRHKARTIQTILDAAEHLFLDQGFHRTTTEQIADVADVAVGSIYFHFGSKDGLYLAIIKRALALLETYLDAIYVQFQTPGEQIYALGDAYVQFAFEHPGYFRMLTFPHVDILTTSTPSPAHAEVTTRVHELIERTGHTLAAALDDPKQQVIATQQLGYFLWGAWNGVISLHLRMDWVQLSQADVVDIVHAGRDVIAAGIAAMVNAGKPVQGPSLPA